MSPRNGTSPSRWQSTWQSASDDPVARRVMDGHRAGQNHPTQHPRTTAVPGGSGWRSEPVRWRSGLQASDDTIDVVAVGGRPWMILLQAPLHRWLVPARIGCERSPGRQAPTSCCRGCHANWPGWVWWLLGMVSVMTGLAHPRRPRDNPGPSRSVEPWLGQGERDPVDVLVQSAGVGAGVGTEGAVGLLGAALQDVEAVIEALTRVGAGHDVAVVGPGRVAEQAATGQPGQVEPVVVTVEGKVAVAEHLVLGLVALTGDPQGRGERGPGG